jgi:diadenylate cyclase
MNTDIFNQIGNFLSDKIRIFVYTLDFSHYPLIILDVLVVAALFYWIYVLIKGTRGIRILIGLMILGLFLIISRLLGLLALGWVLRNFLAVVAIAIPIIFQPELRRALERLGRTDIWSFLKDDKELRDVVSDITSAVRVLARNKIGALIVIKRKTGLEDYIETGTVLNAKVSTKLLLNIFFPKSPLHDGAAIIEGNKVIAAGCTLPLSESDKGFTVGTRHKAALGLSAETDALIIVVSEEKGTIALAINGKLNPRFKKEDLEDTLIKTFKLSKKYLNNNKDVKEPA